jgi:hypothetical protein
LAGFHPDPSGLFTHAIDGENHSWSGGFSRKQIIKGLRVLNSRTEFGRQSAWMDGSQGFMSGALRAGLLPGGRVLRDEWFF